MRPSRPRFRLAAAGSPAPVLLEEFGRGSATGPAGRVPFLRLGPGARAVRIAGGVRGGRGGPPIRDGAGALHERWPLGPCLRLPAGHFDRSAAGHRLQPGELDLGVLPPPPGGDGAPPGGGGLRGGRPDVSGERWLARKGRDGRGRSRRSAQPSARPGCPSRCRSRARLPLRRVTRRDDGVPGAAERVLGPGRAVFSAPSPISRGCSPPRRVWRWRGRSGKRRSSRDRKALVNRRSALRWPEKISAPVLITEARTGRARQSSR